MKILVIRTDRIGEVLLTTPILTALKEKWPEAEISMIIRPEVRGIVEGNPNVDEIIEYKGKIRINKDFDIAIVVNPKKEFHLAAFLAGIPVRVGFDRKWGFLLTHKVRDLKSLAQKHEVEYNLDLVRALDIEPRDRRPFLKVSDTAEHTAMEKLRRQTTAGSDICRLAALHPCTSNPKKQWPMRHFAALGDLLINSGYNVIVVSGPAEAPSAKGMISLMKRRPIYLAGKLTLQELAALFKICRFLVSADSGPVHIAAAVGTRVTALFGRQDPGSNPVRWGPYGAGHVVIEKERLQDILPSEVMTEIHRRDRFPL